MKCDYCDKKIVGQSTKKTISKKKYHFCTEMCFRLHYWQVPYFDLDAVYAERTISLDCPDFKKLIYDQEDE